MPLCRQSFAALFSYGTARNGCCLLRPGGFAKPRPKKAPQGLFCPPGCKAAGTGCSNPPSQHPVKSHTKQKKAAPKWVLPAAAGGIRTSGLWSRRTQTSKPKRRPGAISCRFCTSLYDAQNTGKAFSHTCWRRCAALAAKSSSAPRKTEPQAAPNVFQPHHDAPKIFVLRMKKLCHIRQKLEMPILSIKNLRFDL